jgi:hypothetical protein
VGKPAAEGDSPVTESNPVSREDPEYHQTRETWCESGGTTPQGYILLDDR